MPLDSLLPYRYIQTSLDLTGGTQVPVRQLLRQGYCRRLLAGRLREVPALQGLSDARLQVRGRPYLPSLCATRSATL